MNLLELALKRSNQGRPPVWFMRQAGRYHSHYQQLRKSYSFMQLCKIPEVACEVALGPVHAFDFDAAILFSDLLFPLEAMGMGLRYEEGPKLDWHLRTKDDLKRLNAGSVSLIEMLEGLSFQAAALQKTRSRLSLEKGLLGFVGGPWTLFCYAVEGQHQGSLDSARLGIHDGRLRGFLKFLEPLLIENMKMQANAGATAIAVLDTCAGEVSPSEYQEWIVPSLERVFQAFKKQMPTVPLIYYSKKTGPLHWKSLIGLPFSCLGIDWNHNLPEVLSNWSSYWALQGNIDPHWLLLDKDTFEFKLREIFLSVKALDPCLRQGWICGLGHGILPKTPEAQVHHFLKIQKEIFG